MATITLVSHLITHGVTQAHIDSVMGELHNSLNPHLVLEVADKLTQPDTLKGTTDPLGWHLRERIQSGDPEALKEAQQILLKILQGVHSSPEWTQGAHTQRFQSSAVLRAKVSSVIAGGRLIVIPDSQLGEKLEKCVTDFSGIRIYYSEGLLKTGNEAALVDRSIIVRPATEFLGLLRHLQNNLPENKKALSQTVTLTEMILASIPATISVEKMGALAKNLENAAKTAWFGWTDPDPLLQGRMFDILIFDLTRTLGLLPLAQILPEDMISLP